MDDDHLDSSGEFDHEDDSNTTQPLHKVLTNVEQKEKPKGLLARIGAFACLILLTLDWVAMAEIIQGLQDKDFDKPFFIQFCVHLGYSWLLLVWGIRRLWKGKQKGGSKTIKDYFKATLPVAIIADTCGYTWYLSLSNTSVSANTAIYNSACIFVLFFSVLFLNESISLLKLLAVFVSVLGVVFIAFFSSSDGDSSNNLFGIAMVILSTVLYAAYEVGFKMKCSDPMDSQTDSIFNTTLALGFIGIWTLISIPVFFFLHYTGIEPFMFPQGKKLEQLILTLVMDAFFNAFLLIGIQLSSPLFISVGCMLTIPISVLADWVFHGSFLPGMAYVGIFFVVVGFLLLNLAEVDPAFLNKGLLAWKWKWRKQSNQEEHNDLQINQVDY